MRRSASPAPGTFLGLALLIGLLAPVPGRAASYVTPPIMPIANAWQGRSQAVVRVLDKLDAHVETLTLKAGETGSYKSLSVTVRSCMDRPDGLPVENGAFLDIQDRRGGVQPFSGWTFSGQPSIGVFESPIYAVRLASCGGELVAPLAPPLPAPVPPPESMVSNPPAVPPSNPDAAPDAAGAASGDDAAGDAAPSASSSGGAPAADGPADVSSDGSDAALPDPVYPTGPPPVPPGNPPR